MEGLEAKAVELLDKLEKITVTLTPQALDVAEGCMRVAGLRRVSLAAVVLILSSMVAYKANKSREKRGDIENYECPTQEIIILFSSLIIVFSLCLTVDVWAWIAIFNPKLAIANKLLGF